MDNIEMYQGVDKIIEVSVYDINDQPKILTNGSAIAVFTKIGKASVTLQGNGSISIIENKISITFTPEDSSTMEEGEWRAEVRAWDANHLTEVVSVFIITILKSTTK